MIQRPSPATSGRRPFPHRTTAIATVHLRMLLALGTSTGEADAIGCRAGTRRTLQDPWFTAYKHGGVPLVAASTINAEAQLATRRR